MSSTQIPIPTTADPVDPQPALRAIAHSKCKTEHEHYLACAKRFENGQVEAGKNCGGYYTEYWTCVDKLVGEKDNEHAWVMLPTSGCCCTIGLRIANPKQTLPARHTMTLLHDTMTVKQRWAHCYSFNSCVHVLRISIVVHLFAVAVAVAMLRCCTSDFQRFVSSYEISRSNTSFIYQVRARMLSPLRSFPLCCTCSCRVRPVFMTPYVQLTSQVVYFLSCVLPRLSLQQSFQQLLHSTKLFLMENVAATALRPYGSLAVQLHQCVSHCLTFLPHCFSLYIYDSVIFMW